MKTLQATYVICAVKSQLPVSIGIRTYVLTDEYYDFVDALGLDPASYEKVEIEDRLSMEVDWPTNHYMEIINITETQCTQHTK